MTSTPDQTETPSAAGTPIDAEDDVSFVEQGKRGPGGRPPKLNPTEETLRELRGLGRLHCTQKEGAAFFEVSEPTFNKFLTDHPQAREAFEIGKGQGKISLRRRQWKTAEGNPTMQIWLGKQHLEQRDKIVHTGEDGGPIDYRNLENLTDQELAELARLAEKLDPSTPEGGDPGRDGEAAGEG